MKCAEANEHIMKYFDKELNDIEIGRLKQHCKTCKTCADEFEELEAVLDMVEAEGAVNPPEGFEAGVMTRIKAMDVDRKRKADRLLIFMYGITSVIFLGIATLFIGHLQEISFLEIMGRLTAIFGSAMRIVHALSVSQAGAVVYGLIIIAFAILLGYTGIIIFMDSNIGGIGNEAEK